MQSTVMEHLDLCWRIYSAGIGALSHVCGLESVFEQKAPDVVVSEEGDDFMIEFHNWSGATQGHTRQFKKQRFAPTSVSCYRCNIDAHGNCSITQHIWRISKLGTSSLRRWCGKIEFLPTTWCGVLSKVLHTK